MIMLYPVGFPLFLVCLMLPKRTRIRELQEEVHRQSLIAQRSIHMLDLSDVQRDSYYEETKLIVRYRQGKAAAAAFNRQRRLPAVIIGGLMFTIGVSLVLWNAVFDGPLLYSLLGFSVGALPGLTIAFLAVFPGDDQIIRRSMKFLLCICILLGLSFAGDCISVLLDYFYEGTCVNYNDSTEHTPCWCSPIYAFAYALLTALSFEVSRRILVSLYRRNADGRFELVWGLWARTLFAYAAANTLVLGTFLFFSNGREFLLTILGAIEILSTIASVVLGQVMTVNNTQQRSHIPNDTT